MAEERLHALIEPAVSAAGFLLVRVALHGGRDLTLQVMAEDPATGQLGLDQCAALSRRLSDLLDEADPIQSAYRLEVSSPGIDRPLTRLADFARFAPHVARIELLEGIAIGDALRKRFQGPLAGVEGDHVLLDAEGIGPVRLPFGQIRSAKLVLTDALIRATARLDPAGADILVEEAPDGRRRQIKQPRSTQVTQ